MVWNMFKVKKHQNDVFDVVLVSFLSTLNIFTPFSSDSFLDFEQVNASWVTKTIPKTMQSLVKPHSFIMSVFKFILNKTSPKDILFLPKWKSYCKSFWEKSLPKGRLWRAFVGMVFTVTFPQNSLLTKICLFSNFT